MTDKVFSWIDATALRRMAKLDPHHMSSGPGGQAMLDMFHKMDKATEVFPWTIVVKDFIRRDTQTRAACQERVHLDSTGEYSFTLNYPFRSFASLSAWGEGTDDEAESPAAAAQGNGGFVRQARGRPVGRRVRPLLPAVVARCPRCVRHALLPRSEDLSIHRSKKFGRRLRLFRRRWRCLATCQAVILTGSECLVASGRPLLP